MLAKRPQKEIQFANAGKALAKQNEAETDSRSVSTKGTECGDLSKENASGIRDAEECKRKQKELEHKIKKMKRQIRVLEKEKLKGSKNTKVVKEHSRTEETQILDQQFTQAREELANITAPLINKLNKEHRSIAGASVTTVLKGLREYYDNFKGQIKTSNDIEYASRYGHL